MKSVIFLLSALFIAVFSAFFLQETLIKHGDPGYVLIGYRHWVVETSLVVFIFLLLAGFLGLYFCLRLLSRVSNLPGYLKNRGGIQRSSRSQEALIGGIIDSAEGNWEKAENTLIKHASDSGTPLMHYLTAAKAAQSRGAYEKRDEYLKLAYDSTPGSEIAVGLTQAELHLSEKQFDQALESLTALNSIAPSHGTVLKLLHQTYEALDDWESIRKLIPSLHNNKVLMETEIKLLETQTYSTLLKNAAEQRDANKLTSLWEEIPKHIQIFPGIHSVYFAAMIEAGGGTEIEQSVRERLNKEWNDTLLVLYGCIKTENPAKQLKLAEKWLKKRPKDPVLLRILGKLSVYAENWEKAEKYLGGSLGIDPSVEAYQLLGDLLVQQGDKDRASECFRRGLVLASEEVVKNVEHMPIALDNPDEPEQTTPIAAT